MGDKVKRKELKQKGGSGVEKEGKMEKRRTKKNNKGEAS